MKDEDEDKNKDTDLEKAGEVTIHEIVDPDAHEVSMVDKAANNVRFLIVKSKDGGSEKVILKLPLPPESLASLAKGLSTLAELVASAESEEGISVDEAVGSEITRAVALLKEMQPIEVTPEGSSVVEKALDPVIALEVTMNFIKRKLWDISDRIDSSPSQAINDLLDASRMLSEAIGAYPVAAATMELALAADDIAKCRNSLPAASEVEEVKKVRALLDTLAVAIKPTCVVEKEFAAYKVEVSKKTKQQQDKVDALVVALDKAVNLAARRQSAPVLKALGGSTRPAGNASQEGVVSEAPKPMSWPRDLNAEIDEDEKGQP